MRRTPWRRAIGIPAWFAAAACGGSSDDAGGASGPGVDAGVVDAAGSSALDARLETSGGHESGAPEAGGSGDGSTVSDAGAAGDASAVADAGEDAGSDAAPPGFDVFLATGYQNRRIASLDGTSWVNDVSDPPSSLDDIGTGVAFGLGLVIVTGHTGVYTSPDAKTWTHLPPPLPQQWPGLGGSAAAFAQGTFVVVASNDVWTSSDGVLFTDHPPAGGADQSATHWNGLAFGNGHFFAVGDSNGPGDRKVSEDGATWHDYVKDSPAWHGVAFGAGVFVAVGDGGRRAWTEDGVTLHDTSDASLGDLGGVAFGGGRFVVSGSKGAAWSADGKSWTKQASIPGVTSFGGGLFLTTTWESNVLTSVDGSKFTQVFSGASGSPALARIAWGHVKGP